MSLLYAKTFFWQLLLYIHNKHEPAHVLLLCKSVTAIFVFMPRYGPHFYISMLYISEIFNLTLSLGKASRVTGLKIDFLSLIIKPAISACVAWWFSSPIAGTLVYMGMYKLCDKINLTISWGRS